MELKEEIYEVLITNNFYNTQDAQKIISKVAKELNENESNVEYSIRRLVKEKRILAAGNSIMGCPEGAVKKGVFHDTKGHFGFVSVDGYDRDFYIDNKKGAMDGDVVNIAFVRNKAKQDAFISQIVERKFHALVGRVIQNPQGLYIFKPDNKKFPEYMIPQDENAKNALDKKCSIKIGNNTDQMHFGTINNVFGLAEDPIVENRAIAYQFGFTKEFPQDVLDEVAELPTEVTEKDKKGRIDYTDIEFEAWDPQGCKDKDDAMFVKKTKTGYRVYVAIADVEHYVRRGGKIDQEAYSRGTSCYLGDGVYPMLPPELSNGICSLHDGVPRLAQVAVVDIDEKGELQKFKFQKAVIKVKHSFAYEDAEKVHLCQDGLDEEYKDCKEQVDLLYRVSEILEKKLDTRGNLKFKSYEPTFKFDRTKCEVVDVVDTSNVTSHSVVEQLMILANEAAATLLEQERTPGLFRIHKIPKKERISEVNRVLNTFKIPYTLEPTSKSYQKLLKMIKGNKYEDFLTGVIMRSLTKAIYYPENEGHFGLASTAYLHYTSPIRRYPDLEAHRIIAELSKNNRKLYTKAQLEPRGEHLSDQEKKADEAESLSDKLLCAMWASKHLGENVKGYISKISQGAITLRVNLVEFTIPLFDLENGENVDYRFSKDRNSLVDRESGKTYTLGDELEVKIYKADLDQKVVYATTDMQKEIVVEQKEETEKIKEEEIVKPLPHIHEQDNGRDM